MSTSEWVFLAWGIGLVMGGAIGCEVTRYMIRHGLDKPKRSPR